MAFKVTFSNRATADYGDDDRFTIEPNGVLRIDRGDGRREQFGPVSWFSVQDRPDNAVQVTPGLFRR